MRVRTLIAAVFAAVALTALFQPHPAALGKPDPGRAQDTLTSARVDFARDVQPLLRQRCYACHGPTMHQASLRLDRRADAMRGGTISVIGPGNATGSRLYIRIAGASGFGPQMPPTGALTAPQIDTIKRWIDEGAEWPDALAGEDSAPQPLAPLLRAAAAGDFAQIRALVDSGGDVNVASSDGHTALLTVAGLRGAAATVKLLLDHGAKSSAEAVGFSPLMLAAYTGDDASVRLLLDAGARKNLGVAVGIAYMVGRRPLAEAMIPYLTAEEAAQTVPLLQPPQATGANVAAFVSTAGKHGLNVPVGEAAGPTPRGPDDAEAHPPSPAASARAAVERALPLLQRADVMFLKKSGCVSCHNNAVTMLAVSTARSHGVRVDEDTAQSQVDAVATYLESWRERASLGTGAPGDHDSASYILFGLSAEGFGRTAATDAMSRFLIRMQQPGGRWPIVAERPPIESSDIEVTALSVRALQVYAQKGDATAERAIKAGGTWLARAQPRSNEDRAFQLLGLTWTHAPKSAIAKAARQLAAEQRADGGWAQLPSLDSDAYATGQTLVALEQSGAIAVADPAYRRGVDALLKTQLADGSWRVKTRALPIQPYFESGFPHARDQFISAAASGWAVMALAAAIQ